MAHVLAKDLREAVLQAAIQGKITKQLNSDTLVLETRQNIEKEKNRLIKEKKIKREKLLPITVKESEFLDIPKNWGIIRLGEVISLLSGQDLTSDRYSDKQLGIPYITGASNFVNGNILINRYTSSPTSTAMQGDLLITCKGTIGEIAYLSVEKAHIARQVMSISPIGDANIRYIELLLRYFVDDLKSKAKSMIPGIDRKTVLNIILPFPPIEEQARIVAKVDEIMAKIDEYEKLENQLVKLKEQFPQDMKDSLLQAGMTGKLTEQYHSEHSPLRNLKNDTSEYDSDLPSNWSVAKMMTVSELYTGNSISESIKKSKYTCLSSGYNYIGTKDVGFDCSIAYNNGVKIPYDEPKFKIAKKHSTLLCIEGGSAGKKVGITSEDVCFGNKLCSFNAREYINYKFQFYVIQSPTFKKVFIQNKSGMIGGVSIKKLKEILIPLPPIEEQQRVVDKLDELLPLVDKLAELN